MAEENDTLEIKQIQVESNVYDIIDDAGNITLTPTMDVGGCKKGTEYADKSIREMLEQILCPYVKFTFNSFSGFTSSGSTNLFGNHEHGETVTISKISTTFTNGSRSLNSIKVGTTDGGDDLYSSESVVSGTKYSLTPAQSFTTDGKIYCSLSDGTTTLKKEGSIDFIYYPYYLSSASTTAPTSATKGSTSIESANGTQLTCNANNYLWILSRTNSTSKKIQIYSEIAAEWAELLGGTELPIQVTLTLASGKTDTYYAYRTTTTAASTTTGSIRFY